MAHPEAPQLSDLPQELRARVAAFAGFEGAARLAQTCRAFRAVGDRGLLRALACPDHLATALRATTAAGGPQQRWPMWLVAHAPQLRAVGADPTELAALSLQGAAGLSDDCEAVRLLGQAVLRGELGLLAAAAPAAAAAAAGGAGAGGMASVAPPLLLRVRAAALAAAPPLEAHNNAKPHLAAMEAQLKAAAVAAAAAPGPAYDLPFSVGAVACLAHPAAAEGSAVEAGMMFHLVCGHDRVEVLQALLACAPFVERLPEEVLLPILYAVCERGRVQVLQALLACAPFVERMPKDYLWMLLAKACEHGQAEVLQQLLALLTSGAYVGAAGPSAGRILFSVCNRGQAEVLQQLLACASFVERIPKDYLWMLLAKACERGQAEVLQQLLALLASGAYVGAAGPSADHILFSVCKRGQAEALQQLLACASFVELLEESELCWPALAVACKDGHAEVVRQLLACGHLADLVHADLAASEDLRRHIQAAADRHPAVKQELAAYEAFRRLVVLG
ncbi:hypothetical protein HYH02_003310 [Chlamydomonas schloesseri]|uniref:F-box domain-containing protein n=1 Tax=Chlamydomonas schloesseri TaxID=2026947 RepID=A0A836BA17_9CHLO|nr:hypothetical protein HYH02_003310 [Chlamydomonas schloesseri]|eukprot:KAG2452286.1 hypothetical protein HYH02_003310 [Chlamydomonas schloesseri]